MSFLVSVYLFVFVVFSSSLCVFSCFVLCLFVRDSFTTCFDFSAVYSFLRALHLPPPAPPPHPAHPLIRPTPFAVNACTVPPF